MCDIGHEPSLEEPEEQYLTPDCGHECYQDDEIIEWIEGKRIITMCADCLMDRLKDMTIQEVADMVQCNHFTVRF